MCIYNLANNVRDACWNLETKLDRITNNNAFLKLTN